MAAQSLGICRRLLVSGMRGPKNTCFKSKQVNFVLTGIKQREKTKVTANTDTLPASSHLEFQASLVSSTYVTPTLLPFAIEEILLNELLRTMRLALE